jgi:antitoxin (DNA-binding transcriptional repressor) of toxin-antitoxin stability system
MREMSVSQFKATCLARFDEIARGGDVIVITKRGVPIAQVGPVAAAPARRRALGGLAGTLVIRADLDQLSVEGDPEQDMLAEWAELGA